MHPTNLYVNSTVDTPDFTGIPPDILILAKFESMTLQLEEMQRSLNASFEATLKRELDNRKIGGSDSAQLADIKAQLASLLQLAHSNNANVNRNNGCEGGDADDDGGDDGDGFELFHDESGVFF